MPAPEHSMPIINSIVAQALSLDVALHEANARMEASTDAEALHDLRVNARRLKSLLRPLRKFDDVKPLDRAASKLLKLTSPLRDLEVLADELARKGATRQARSRQAAVSSGYADIVQSQELEQLFAELDEFPANMRAAKRSGELRRLKKRIARKLQKQLHRLQAALDDPEHDRHKLRILIKRLRYAHRAYPQLSPISKKTAKALKHAQSDLGDWHDQHLWSQNPSQETDLQPLQENWAEAAASALDDAEATIVELRARLQRGGK
jgi:CHAD domain-containing protein